MRYARSKWLSKCYLFRIISKTVAKKKNALEDVLLLLLYFLFSVYTVLSLRFSENGSNSNYEKLPHLSLDKNIENGCVLTKINSNIKSKKAMRKLKFSRENFKHFK